MKKAYIAVSLTTGTRHTGADMKAIGLSNERDIAESEGRERNPINWEMKLFEISGGDGDFFHEIRQWAVERGIPDDKAFELTDSMMKTVMDAVSIVERRN